MLTYSAVYLLVPTLLIVHQHTSVCLQEISGTENIGWTFNKVLNLCCDLDGEHSDPIISQDMLTYNDVPLNQAWLQKIQQFSR